ncbi:MAG TPA: hypothetical protein VIL36_02065 [Acidimicrobiales bacterium]
MNLVPVHIGLLVVAGLLLVYAVVGAWALALAMGLLGSGSSPSSPPDPADQVSAGSSPPR